jgi:superfamily II DNA/RNA helicase
MTLPIALAGSDLIGQARTGTGKTLGFGVPLLQRIELGGSAPRRWSSSRPGSCASRSPATCRPPAPASACG